MTASDFTDPDWKSHAMCAIAEGFCPNAHGQLSTSADGETFTSYSEPVVTAFASGGWCATCRIWWRITELRDGPYVTANYPTPKPAIAPYDMQASSKVPLPGPARARRWTQ